MVVHNEPTENATTGLLKMEQKWTNSKYPLGTGNEFHKATDTSAPHSRFGRDHGVCVFDIDAVKGEAPIRRRIHATSLNPIACGSRRRRVRHVFGNRNRTWRRQPNHEFVELKVHRLRPPSFRNLEEFNSTPPVSYTHLTLPTKRIV